MNRRGGAPTRKDVAALAGVAPSTVSLVLNGTQSARVAPATRQRIFDAVEHLGYRPNHVARSLVSGRTMTVGVVMHWVDAPFNGYTSRLMDGVWTRLREANYRLLMVSGDRSEALAEIYRERCVDGLLVFAAPRQADDAELREAVATGFPLVFVGGRPESAPADYVDIDNRSVGRAATERLLAAGCRRILHLTGPTEVNSSAVDRLAGYRDALEAAGITYDPALVRYGSYSEVVSRAAVLAACDEGLRFDGIFAANLGMARGARAALGERGIRIPDDVAVVTIDSAAVAGREEEVSTFAQPLVELGTLAAERLLALIADPGLERCAHHLPCRWIDAGTVAPH